jgi:hypothetical protein
MTTNRTDDHRFVVADLAVGADTIRFHRRNLPQLDNDRLREPAVDIDKNGLVEPLVKCENKILVGEQDSGRS